MNNKIMNNKRVFWMGAFVGIVLGLLVLTFGWMFHFDAVPHFLFPIISVLCLPLWFAGITTGKLIDWVINFLVEFYKSPPKYGDWPYNWGALYNWLKFGETILWMAIGYGLLALLIVKIVRHFKKVK